MSRPADAVATIVLPILITSSSSWTTRHLFLPLSYPRLGETTAVSAAGHWTKNSTRPPARRQTLRPAPPDRTSRPSNSSVIGTQHTVEPSTAMSLAVPPQSPGTRARSVSQPLREGIETDFFHYAASLEKPQRPYGRSLSSQSISRADSYGRRSSNTLMPEQPRKGRARSGSLVAVTEVGGDEPDSINDRVGVGANNNAAWVNSPGAWIMHPVLIISAKILIDAIPHMTQDLCWTLVNLGYMGVSTTTRLWQVLTAGYIPHVSPPHWCSVRDCVGANNGHD